MIANELEQAATEYARYSRKQHEAFDRLEKTENAVFALAMNLTIDMCELEMEKISDSVREAGMWKEFCAKVERKVAQ